MVRPDHRPREAPVEQESLLRMPVPQGRPRFRAQTPPAGHAAHVHNRQGGLAAFADRRAAKHASRQGVPSAAGLLTSPLA